MLGGLQALAPDGYALGAVAETEARLQFDYVLHIVLFQYFLEGFDNLV
jgi:hypothetical protein